MPIEHSGAQAPPDEPGAAGGRDPATPPPRRRRRLGIALAAVVLVPPLAGLAVVAWQVDDWSRDLTTNVARTAADASHPALRPLHTERSREDVVEAVRQAAAGLPGWAEEGVAEEGPRTTLHLVRTSRLFGFRDDVTVWVEDRGGARRVTAESRSRLGKGDLGQNPRNLRALLSAVRGRLEAGPPAPVQPVRDDRSGAPGG